MANKLHVLKQRPYLRTETSYKDGIWLIAFTITCKIDQGVLSFQYILLWLEIIKIASLKKSQ